MTKVWYENPPGAGPAQGLYSHVGRSEAGGLAFVAGQVAVRSDGSIAGTGDFAVQFRQVFQNLGDILKGMGGGYASVVKFTTFLVRREDIPVFVRERNLLFPTLFAGASYPPNTLLIVNGLVKEELLLEVEAIAAL